MKENSIYASVITTLFLSKFRPGQSDVEFTREELILCVEKLKLPVLKNIGDLIYTFRYRADLPASIRDTAPAGKVWTIEAVGRAMYRSHLSTAVAFAPNPAMAVTKVPDSTPGIVARYALTDEQSLLAKLWYNRLINIFTSVTVYSLQSHLRTAVPGVGQIETDEIYVGVGKTGAQWAFPVQAKSGRDKLSIVQIQQSRAARLGDRRHAIMPRLPHPTWPAPGTAAPCQRRGRGRSGRLARP